MKYEQNQSRDLGDTAGYGRTANVHFKIPLPVEPVGDNKLGQWKFWATIIFNSVAFIYMSMEQAEHQHSSGGCIMLIHCLWAELWGKICEKEVFFGKNVKIYRINAHIIVNNIHIENIHLYNHIGLFIGVLQCTWWCIFAYHFYVFSRRHLVIFPPKLVTMTTKKSVYLDTSW